MSRTTIVVPCYNEAERLDVRRFEQFVRHDSSIDFLLVNDGSRDTTLELLERLHAGHPRRFSFLHLAQNSGKAEAVRQGLNMALAAHPDYVGFWDADLATGLEDIPRFVAVLDEKPGIELVVATRMRLLGRAIERRLLRHYLGRAFANVASLALGLKIYDTQCGAKLLRATPDLARVLAQPFLTRWIFDVEILARLKQARLKQTQCGTALPPLERIVYEYPLDAWRDVAGSKVRPGDFATAFFEMGRIYWTYLRPGAAQPPPLAPPPPLNESSSEKKRAA